MTTPAETLRSAARLMRERALAATQGPWKAHDQNGDWYVSSVPFGQVSTGINEEPSLPEFLMIERDRRDAEFIAGMQPLVALAVADWLDDRAEDAEFLARALPYLSQDSQQFQLALAVARAYLGKTEAAHECGGTETEGAER
jgi:hypothetical protein